MLVPGLVVGDAGQAYEAIALDRIYACLDRLFDQLESEKTQRCVTVMRSQRSHVFFGGGVNQRLWDRTVWLLRSIRRALEGFLGMRLFVICGLVVQQVRGIPIGAPLSGAILHTVLSDLEFQSDKMFPRRRRSVATGRYVDDIILASKVCCSKCLRRMVNHIYIWIYCDV